MDDTEYPDLNPQDLRVHTYRQPDSRGGFGLVREFCVRLDHVPSGIYATAEEERSVHANKAVAYKLLCKLVAEHKKRPGFVEFTNSSVNSKLDVSFNDIKGQFHNLFTQNSELMDHLKYIGRCANRHGTKSTMTAEDILSCIQHYPPIKEITKSYKDGVIPKTPDVYGRIASLEQELKDMTAMYHGQCRITDELADKLEKEKELKGDVRIAELEIQLASVNRRLGEANEQFMKLTKV